VYAAGLSFHLCKSRFVDIDMKSAKVSRETKHEKSKVDESDGNDCPVLSNTIIRIGRFL